MQFLGIFDQKCLIWVFLDKNFFKKNYCQIWNQHPQICLFAKYDKEIKMPKFGTKSALFWYFWAGIWQQYCHILNQQLRMCLTAIFCRKTETTKFGTKNALFGYFWTRIVTNYCHICNRHPQICQKWVFNSYSEFGIGSDFSKDPGSTFSECPGPGPGLLCKICRMLRLRL